MTTHEVKCWPEFFGPIALGIKTFDLRRNDRDYKVGDFIKLKEWNPVPGEYTGDVCVKRIVYILDATGPTPEPLPQPKWGLERGYCILSLADSDSPK